MKKFVVLSLIALLVLAFGSMAFAQAKKEEPKLEFKASGFIDMVTLYWRNQAPQTGPIFGAPAAAFLPPHATLTGSGTQFDKKNSAWTTRGHLKFDAVYGKAMSGTIFFEMDADRWGGWSSATASPLFAHRNTTGRWGGDELAVEIKNLYFDFAIPPVIPVAMQVRAGLQPLSVRPHAFLYTDGTGVKLDAMIDPATISLFYFKALEGKDAASDDVDVYGLQASAKVATLTLGGYGFYYNMNTYPVDSATVIPYGANSGYQSNMLWLGAFAGGKLGPVVLDFDFVYNTGEIEASSALVTPVGAKRDVDFSGWMSRIRVDFPWEKFNFGVVGMYATGADMRKTSASGLPGSTVASGATFGHSRKVGSYVVPPFSENFAFGDGMVIQTGWVRAMTRMTVASGSQVNRGSIGGTAYAQAYASFKPTPWYKVTLKGMYIWDTTKNGNTIGNAVRATGLPRDDRDIGWEVDLINEINIYRNLKWDIALGYLWAGDALDYRVGTTNVNKGPKNPYNVHTRLMYTF